MTDTTELAPEWAERIEKARSDVAGWYGWLEDPHPAEPSSALHSDDRIHTKRPVREMAWQGLIAATDNLGLLVDGLKAVGPRPVAYFTLARASLFAASRTVWILQPSSRQTRRERALWVAYEETRNLKNLIVAASASDPADPVAVAALADVEADMTDLKQLAQTELGLTLNQSGKTSDTDIVTEAANYLDPTRGDQHRGIMMAWRVNSGHAHGLSWPNILRRPTEGSFVGPDGRNYQKQVPDHAAIAEAVVAATLMTRKAFSLYKERAASHVGP